MAVHWLSRRAALGAAARPAQRLTALHGRVNLLSRRRACWQHSWQGTGRLRHSAVSADWMGERPCALQRPFAGCDALRCAQALVWQAGRQARLAAVSKRAPFADGQLWFIRLCVPGCCCIIFGVARSDEA